MEDMTRAMSDHGVLSGIGRFLGHAAAVVLGLIMMVVGLGLSMTIVMLPFGMTIGLLGVATLVAGLFAGADDVKRRS
jgi:hypothetical protein